jgi:hypothetical protein
MLNSYTFTLRYLGLFSLLLGLLLVVLNANAGFEQNNLANALMWIFQVPLGFLTLAVLWNTLRGWSFTSNWHVLAQVIVSAILSSMFIAPIYMLLEFGVAFALGLAYPEPLPVSVLEWLTAAAREWQHIVVPFVVVWLLVTLPVLDRISRVSTSQYPTRPKNTTKEINNQKNNIQDHIISRNSSDSFTADNSAVIISSLENLEITPNAASKPLDEQALSLPSEIRGTWLMAKSELQYIRVWTDLGNALILGSLTQVEDFYGPKGMRVHKSWWVALEAIAQVSVRSGVIVLEMCNGLEVPVSRRKKQAFLQRPT